MGVPKKLHLTFEPKNIYNYLIWLPIMDTDAWEEEEVNTKSDGVFLMSDYFC